MMPKVSQVEYDITPEQLTPATKEARFVLLTLKMRSNIYPMSFFDTAMFKVDSPLLLLTLV
jgi:hypothetical protein